MRAAFRTDAGLEIGAGHMMRCLTLAEALRSRGAECLFLARNHIGHMHGVVEDRGFKLLPLGPVDLNMPTPHSAYSHWLGAAAPRDAHDTLALLSGLSVDWLVVDHYGIDARWEISVREGCNRLLVIDDLANRDHLADALLDQNLGRKAADYAGLAPKSCNLIIGPHFALLREEFAAMRAKSLSRRDSQPIRRLIVTMGGVDLHNASGAVLDAISDLEGIDELKVTVVLGPSAIWREKVIAQANQLPFHTEVLENVRHIASLMCDADVAIGAAGSTSWERCCLGLPTILLVLADNQRSIAQALADAGAAYVVERKNLAEGIRQAISEFISAPDKLVRMSQAAAKITDGIGAERVVGELEKGMCA